MIGRVIARPFVGTTEGRLPAHAEPQGFRHSSAGRQHPRSLRRVRPPGRHCRQDRRHLRAPEHRHRTQGRIERRSCLAGGRQPPVAPRRRLHLRQSRRFRYGVWAPPRRAGLRSLPGGVRSAAARYRSCACAGRHVADRRDHGNDPTWTGTDHTRERAPVMIGGPGLPPGVAGVRATFADVGATVASHLRCRRRRPARRSLRRDPFDREFVVPHDAGDHRLLEVHAPQEERRIGLQLRMLLPESRESPLAILALRNW